MISTWIVSATLFAAAFGAAIPVGDDPYTDKFNAVITDINSDLEDHLHTEVDLPDLGHFDFEPMKLRNGKLGQFNTIQLQGEPEVTADKNKDNTTTLSFKVKLGLKDLVLQYDYNFNLLGYSSDGHVSVTPTENEVGLRGIIVTGDKYCDARLDSFSVDQLGDYKIDVKSSDNSTTINEVLKGFLSPVVRALINTSLEGVLYAPPVQKKFSQLVCKEFSN